MQVFWQKCLDNLREFVQSAPKIYDTWFKVINPVAWDPDNGVLTLEAPASKVRFLRDTYLKNIQRIATHVNDDQPVTVSLIAAQKEAAEVQKPSVGTSESDVRRREETGLLPGLTFENYVNGNANQLAVAAAEHVATTTGTQYNPLYIYGGVGLGKTHLMQAIGHRYLDLHPKAKVRCVSAQDFINEYTAAVRESANKTHASLEKFDERYRNLDLLLIDDVQSLSGAKGSQGQFFRAFEALVPHNKQLVITSDTYTRGLKDIEPRLISRLSQGLSVAIEQPALTELLPHLSWFMKPYVIRYVPLPLLTTTVSMVLKKHRKKPCGLTPRMHRKSLPVLNSLVNWMTVKSIWSGYILTRTIKYLITN